MLLDIKLDKKQFDFIRKMITTETGIVLGEHKLDMVSNRLRRRLKELRLGDFDAYCNLLRDPLSGELMECINAVTTNVTALFREPAHFDYLKSTVFPFMCELARKDRKLRMWSAGCSIGMEPYSIAITAHEHFGGELGRWDFKLLATDLDSKCVSQGASGIYASELVDGLSAERRARWFKDGSGARGHLTKASQELRRLITFNQLNLMGSWPMKQKFQAIFCRNVMIYFDRETQRRLVDRYAQQLVDGGYLFIGHSETLSDISTRFKLVSQTTYRKLN
ncbi:MAG: protein-glutamate O-methyltransferase CheR [Planctomycetes bacterium]|nr:protein-glutamate O-methyltransferase CheR [Planctomycetota bacterium]